MSVSSASPSTVASSTPASSGTPHSRIPIASYRLRTPTSTSSRSSGICSPKHDHKLESLPSTAAPWMIHSSPTALQTTSDRGTDRDQPHQRSSAVSSLHSYGHSLSIYSTTSPTIISTALAAPLTPTPRHQSHHHQASASIASIYSARSTDALKSPVSIDRTSTDAIKSPLASSLHTLGALKHRRQLSRTSSVNSVESARTKRISSPVFQAASSGIYPTAEEREEQQRRASMEHQEPSSPEDHFLHTKALSLYAGIVNPKMTRQRLLSTAHEVDDEQDGHHLVPVPSGIVMSQDNTAGADVCVKTPTHTSKSADATFQSRFSHSPGPGRGLKESKTRPDWLSNPPSLPLIGSLPILRKSFSDAQRPSIGALEREAARCASPAFSLHASRHRKLVQALRHPKALKKDKDASLRQKDENDLIHHDTAASIHSSGLPSRNSQQTFTSVERRPSSRSSGLVRAIHRTGRTLRERLGSKPPGTPHPAHKLDVEPAVPPRTGRLSLDRPNWLTQSAMNTAASTQNILPDGTSQQPATPKHDGPKQGATAFVSPPATFGKEQSVRSGSIGSTLRRRPRLLSKTRRRSRQTSTNTQPSANCDLAHQTPAASLIRSGAATMLDSSIRESWIDISTDVQQEGFTAVNGQGRKQKQSWYLSWKRSRRQEKQSQRSLPSTPGPTGLTGPPPSLPLVPSGQAFFRGASILFASDVSGTDAPPPNSRDPGQQQKVVAPATSAKPPPHRSLLLPALQEVELKTRPVVALPQRARGALKSDMSTSAATASLSKPVGLSETTLKPLLMSVASSSSRPTLGELPSLPRSQAAQQRPAKTTSPSLPIVKEPCPSPKKQPAAAPPARSPSLTRNTDSLPVPPRRLSRARISSEEELKSSVGATERDLTKTSVRSATTISSSILFSDVEMALNRLLDEQPEGKDAPKKLMPGGNDVDKAALIGAADGLPGLDDWIDEDDCDSNRANQTFYHESMASAEKRLADALVRYLQASRSPDRSPQAHRALRDVLDFAKVLSPVSHSSDIGDVTAITDKLRNLVTQFRNTPASTPSRRHGVTSTHTSQHHLRTPEHRRTVGGSPMRKSGSSPAGMLTPEKWRQDERRRHSRKRSSAVASSIGHSVMSYCSTAMSSSAEDVTSLLETLMDGPNEQGGGEMATPASTRKRKESESDGINTSQRLSWTVDLPRMAMLQESHIVFGMPHAQRMSSATDASADTSGQCGPNEDDATLLVPPLQSILRFYETQNPDWHGEAVPHEAHLKPNSPNSKRRAVAEEDGTSKATPVPVQAFDGSPCRIPAKPNLRSQRRHLVASQSTTPGSPHRRVRRGTPSSTSVPVSPDRRSPRIAPTTSPSARASEASTSRSPITCSGGFKAPKQKGAIVGQEKDKRDGQAMLTKDRVLTASESAIRKSSLSSTELVVTSRVTRSQTRRVTGPSQNSDLFGSPVDSKASTSLAPVPSIPTRGGAGAPKRLSRSKPKTSTSSVLLSPPPAVVVTDADVEAKFQSLAAFHGSERNASASSMKHLRSEGSSNSSPAVPLKTLPEAGSPFKSIAADRSD